MLIRIAVTRPLTRLGEGIQQIVATGRFDRKIRRRGRDEIGVLIDGFNGMMDHLKEKTEHLEESEKRFRLLTENARDAIVSFLANGQIILFNRQAQRIFGYSRQEALGMTIERLVHEECASLHNTATEEYLKNRGGELMSEVRKVPARRRDGSRVDLELSLSVAESDGHLFYTAILRE
jgi:PAS domain S-box-containing protein